MPSPIPGRRTVLVIPEEIGLPIRLILIVQEAPVLFGVEDAFQSVAISTVWAGLAGLTPVQGVPFPLHAPSLLLPSPSVLLPTTPTPLLPTPASILPSLPRPVLSIPPAFRGPVSGQVLMGRSTPIVGPRLTLSPHL